MMWFPPSIDTTVEQPSSSFSHDQIELDEDQSNKKLNQQGDGDDKGNAKEIDSCSTINNTQAPNSTPSHTPGDKIAAKFASLDGRRLATLDGRRMKKMTALAKEKTQDLKENTNRSSDPRIQKAMAVVGITDHSKKNKKEKDITPL
jgi:hypothetical protein